MFRDDPGFAHCRGKKAVNPLLRGGSVIKCHAGVLLRSANESERLLSSRSEIEDKPICVSGNLLPDLMAEEIQLTHSIAGAAPTSFRIRVIEQNVIRQMGARCS